MGKVRLAEALVLASLLGTPGSCLARTEGNMAPPGVAAGPAMERSGIEGGEKDFSLRLRDWKWFVHDTAAVLSSPLRWRGRQWLVASLVAGATAGVYVLDDDIDSWVQRNRSQATDDAAIFAKPFGDPLYTLPPLVGAYVYGRMFKSPRAQRTALLGMESFALTAGLTTGVKFLAHRHRPDTPAGKDSFDGPGISTANLSFVSGHASSAFALATVVASEYGETSGVAPVAYGLATLTALSRVNDQRHWASDVFLGAAIGYFTAKAVVHLNRQRWSRDITVVPVVSREGAAVVVSYRF